MNERESTGQGTEPGNGNPPPAPAVSLPAPRNEAGPAARLSALEAAVDGIRTEILEVRRIAEAIAGALPARLESIAERAEARTGQQQAGIEDLSRRMQEFAERSAERFRAAEEEGHRVAAAFRDLGDRSDSRLSEVRERLEGLAGKAQALGEEIAGSGQILILLKGLAEKNGVALREIREQGQEILESCRAQNLRSAETDARALEEQARENNRRGVTMFYRGAVEAAAEHFLRATELHPTFPEAFNNLGLACSRLGRPAEAVQAFQQAIQLDPGLAEAFNNLGFLYHSQLDYPKAVDMFRKALLTNGDFAEAYANLGNSFYMLKQNDRAVAAWKRAIEIDPLHENARRSLRMFEQREEGSAAPAPPAAEPSETPEPGDGPGDGEG